MNWDAIGAIGEIIGATAVVVSLFYLATQIRVQNRESRIASIHQVVEGYRTSIAWLSDPQTWDAAIAPARDLFGTDTFAKFWLRRKHHFRKDFANYVEGLEPGSSSLWE